MNQVNSGCPMTQSTQYTCQFHQYYTSKRSGGSNYNKLGGEGVLRSQALLWPSTVLITLSSYHHMINGLFHVSFSLCLSILSQFVSAIRAASAALLYLPVLHLHCQPYLLMAK